MGSSVCVLESMGGGGGGNGGGFGGCQQRDANIIRNGTKQGNNNISR